MSYEITSARLSDALGKIAARGSGSLTSSELSKIKREAFWLTSNAPLAPSIDNLLHSHRSNENITELGKLLICDCLYESEQNSVLMPDTSLRSDISYLHKIKGNLSASNSWLSRMFWLLAEGSSFHDFLQKLSSIKFICFNYDRCIEHYLSNAAISYFKLTAEDAQKALDGIKIIHPYGSLGKLSVQDGWVSGFGECRDLHASSTQIKTFTEGLLHESHRPGILQAIESADRLIFLGFGFIPLNMDILFKEIKMEKMPMITGTSKGISDSSARIIKDLIVSYPGIYKKPLMKPKDYISLQDLTCCEFMDVNSFEFRK